MADRTYEMLVAIVAALAADSSVLAIVGADATGAKVYSASPGEVTAPYVVVGDVTSLDYPMSAMDGQEHTVTVHCWTEQESKAQVLRLMAAVRAALHDRPPRMSAGDFVNLRCEFGQTLADPDGRSMHGVLRFRAVTHN